MIRSVKLVGSMCLFVFTLFVQAQEIQPKGNQPDSLMNQFTNSRRIGNNIIHILIIKSIIITLVE